jgi:hypothetical protein
MAEFGNFKSYEDTVSGTDTINIPWAAVYRAGSLER